jgi:GrpB-like predicted nucleotidyltransferase (UPF0157 family)/broad-specificity NMP kinase
MIGLKRGTVKLASHNPKWKELFKEEKRLLKRTFGDVVIAIEHIGSTAIPGIPAKPIIDMDVGVKSLKIARNMKEKFEKLGYKHRPFMPGRTKEELKWQELYVKGSEEKRTFHAHVTVYGNDYWKNDLLFCAYLRKNPARAKQYAKLKQALVKKYGKDRRKYTKNKEQFIRETLQLAKRRFFIIIRGPLGCGKSTISMKITKILNAEYIPIDRVLDEHNLTEDREDGYVSQRSFKKANKIIAQKAKKKLQSRTPIVFDGNFYWKSQIDDLIQRLDFPHYVFTLKAPLEVCIERDRQRGKTHGEDAAGVVYKKATEFDYGIVIDISKSLNEAVENILSYISK